MSKTSVFAKKQTIRDVIRNNYIVRNLKADYDLPYDVNVAFVADPNLHVVKRLFDLFTKYQDYSILPESEQTAIDQEMCELASKFIVETDIEGISFESPTEIMAALNHNELHPAMFGKAMFARIMEVVNALEELKKSTTGQEKA